MKKCYSRSLAGACLMLCAWGVCYVLRDASYYSLCASTSRGVISKDSHHLGTLQQTTKTAPYKRTAIVVFASMRTGSSFFGEYFNQHSEIYYLYDPLHGAGWGDNGALLRQNILWDLLRCNYSRISEMYTSAANDRWKHCRNGVCFPDRSKFLWRNTHLCDSNGPICSERLDPKVLEKVCRQSLLTTVKEIAMASLSELEPILADSFLDVKVIQLVRDPRPVVPSRLKMSRPSADYSKTDKTALDVCNHYARNIPYMEQCILGKRSTQNRVKTCNNTIQELWNGRFLRISHEYVSENPMKALEVLYNFAGLNYDANVAKWIKENTAARQEGTEQQYSRTRNSKAVISAWRTRETFEHIDIIQKHCMAVMAELGYVPVRNEEEMKNLSFPLYDTTKHVIIP